MDKQSKIIEKIRRAFEDKPNLSFEKRFKYKLGPLAHALENDWLKQRGYSSEDIEQYYELRKCYVDITPNVFKIKEEELIQKSIGVIDVQVQSIFENEIYFLTKQFGISVKALDYYKQKNYCMAANLTHEVIIFCTYLMSIGHPELILRVVEQYVNLSRIYFHAGKEEESFDVWKELLMFVLIDKKTDMNGLTISPIKNNPTTKYILELAIKDWFCNWLGYLLKVGHSSFEKEKKMFRVVFNALLEKKIRNLSTEKMIFYKMLKLMNSYYDGEFEVFVKNSLKFISSIKHIRYNEVIVWLSIKINALVKVQSGIDTITKESIANQILEYVNAIVYVSIEGKDFESKKIISI
jgi:hypothetical protein